MTDEGPVLVFADTETTGVELDCDIWEIAAIRVEPDGREFHLSLQVRHDLGKMTDLPEKFRADHDARFDPARAVSRRQAAAAVHNLTLAATASHLVGVGADFDAQRLSLLLSRYGLPAPWHYHVIDLNDVMLGALAARGKRPSQLVPFTSDGLAEMLGVPKPPQGARHTAMGDVQWGRAIWQAVFGG